MKSILRNLDLWELFSGDLEAKGGILLWLTELGRCHVTFVKVQGKRCRKPGDE
jgi:hypothetical protein